MTSIFENTSDPLGTIKIWKAQNCASEFLLTIRDCRELIKGFLSNKISASQMTAWAEFVELSDWVNYECDHSSVIADFLFEVSTPAINGDVSENLTLTKFEQFDELVKKSRCC